MSLRVGLIHILLISVCVLALYSIFGKVFFLNFSDSAKYADLARNMIEGRGYGTNFTFWNESKLNSGTDGLFNTSILPVHPFLIAIFFKLYGVNDFSVVLTSSIFFMFSSLLIFLLGSKIFSKKTGFLAAVLYILNPDILNYATSGGTESVFIFEILLALFLFSQKTKTNNNVLCLIVLCAMYLTKPQAFIYIAGALVFWFAYEFPVGKAILYFSLTMIAGLVVDIFVLRYFDGDYFLYSITTSGSFLSSNIGINQSSSDILRGLKVEQNLTEVIKRFAYNLYNYYRLAPKIVNPYILAMFGIFVLINNKRKISKSFLISSMFMILITIVVASFTIPLHRYIHPIIPLICLGAAAAMIWIVDKAFEGDKNYRFVVKDLKTNIPRKVLVNFTLVVMVSFFVIGQTFGLIFLDSRFERKSKNIGKPPIYSQMSKILKEDTLTDEVVVTNLDTWGSWYGERKTVWYPVDPNHMEKVDTVNHFDAIYLTSYLMDDANYYMGESWRQAFLNPESIENKYLNENYEFYKEYSFSEEDNYERMNGRAVLLKRKN